MDTELSRIKLVLSGLLTTMGILLFVYVSISNQSSILGGNLSHIQGQIMDIQQQNLLLEEKIDTMSAYTTIHAKAVKAGFIEGRNGIVYLW